MRFSILITKRELQVEEAKPLETEEAQATLFKIEKDMAEGFHKNKDKQDRKKADLDAMGGFRVPESVGRQPTRFGYRITQNRMSGEVGTTDSWSSMTQGTHDTEGEGAGAKAVLRLRR